MGITQTIPTILKFFLPMQDMIFTKPFQRMPLLLIQYSKQSH